MAHTRQESEMLSGDIEDYELGQAVVFHDQHQCEIRGAIRGMRYRGDELSLTIELDGGGYYDARIPKRDEAPKRQASRDLSERSE